MYEVGDKVIYQGADKSAYKKVGVLKSIEEKDGKPQLTVEFEGGETFTAPVDDWSREFANACKNAKFKVGDKVTDGSGVYLVTGIDNDFGSYEWKLISGRGDSSHSEGGDFNWAESKMKIVNACKNAKFKVGDKVKDFYFTSPYTIVRIGAKNKDGIQLYVGKNEYGNELVFKEDDLTLANSCRSTNAVVANAMAANRKVACNADIYSLVKQEFKAQYPYKDFGIDMQLEPDGKFKIWEVGSAHGPNDSSGVDWKRIAAKVKSAIGSQISSIRATPYNNGVEGVMARNSVARNAEFFDSKEFGSHDVKTEIGDYGKGTGYHISIYTDGLTSSSSWGDKGKKCIAEAKQSLAVMQRKTSALKQAISWMEQNAK